MARDPVLVFGATGTQGGAVADGLLAADIPVSAFVRDPLSQRSQALASRGANLIVGDLGDVSSIERALAGVQVAYAVTTPFEHGADEEIRQGEAIIAAATRAQLPWLILASVASAAEADVPHFKSKARIEQSLRQSALKWTVIAPSYFYENVLSLRESVIEGRLPLALPPHTPLQQLALHDLGALVAAVISRPSEHIGQRIEVAADSPTPQQMAQAIGIRYEQVPSTQLAQRNPDLAAMYSFLAHDGYRVDVDALKQRYSEIRWQSFAEWAAGTDWQNR
jgi:uncharacterized protein YbjT (DUF2867 family)